MPSAVAAGDNQSLRPLHFVVCFRCLQLLLPVTTREALFTDVHQTMHPLLLSLQLETTECLEILIAAGMNVKDRLTIEAESIGNTQDSILFFRTLQYSADCSILCHIGYSWPLKGVEFLLRAGLPCSAEQSDELPPILMAISRGAAELFCLLLRYGAKPNVYHPKVTGNLVTLLSLKFDLRCQNIVTDPRSGVARNLYARFLSNVIIHGGDVSSCLRTTHDNSALVEFDIFNVLGQCTAVNNMFPVLSFMYLFSCNVPLEKDLTSAVLKEEWVPFFSKAAGKIPV